LKTQRETRRWIRHWHNPGYFNVMKPQRETRRWMDTGISQAFENVLAKPTRHRQLEYVRFKVTSRLFTLMKQKAIFVYPF
jgi:hypothetical protein